MFLGLRMTEGVSCGRFADAFGMVLDDVYGPVVEKLIQDGLMTRREGRLALTEWGLDVSNYVMSQFLLD